MISQHVLLLGALLAGALTFLLRIGRREKSLPPGPPTFPLLGNLHVFPQEPGLFHFKFAEWARRYGDIISIKISSQTMVVLSSATAVRQVVDKTGWIGSSRNSLHLVELCVGNVEHILFAPGTPGIRTLRKAIALFFSKQNIVKHSPVEAESTQLLYELVANPSQFKGSVRRFTHSIIKCMIYGQRAPVFDSPDVTQFYDAMDEMGRINTPGAYPPIDLLPVLKYLPDRFAPWTGPCRTVREQREAIHRKLYKQAESRRVGSEYEEGRKCFMDWVKDEAPELEQEFVSYSGLVLIDGGSDTSGASLLSIILALASHPMVQARAKMEVDSVVGDRLPMWSDIEKMPYLRAMLKEIQRMRPPLPMGAAHAVEEDVFYKGHVIPKGTTVILNNYAITNDPDVFEDPETFRPERFLETEFGTMPGTDTDFRDSFAFGGGRRICPGQWLARYTTEVMTMRLLWAFDMSDPVDAHTKRSIPPGLGVDHFEFALVAMPHPFDCKIVPRPERAHNIKENYIAAMGELAKYEVDLLEQDMESIRSVKRDLDVE